VTSVAISSHLPRASIKPGAATLLTSGEPAAQRDTRSCGLKRLPGSVGVGGFEIKLLIRWTEACEAAAVPGDQDLLTRGGAFHPVPEPIAKGIGAYLDPRS
jgi:hypothetical protein